MGYRYNITDEAVIDAKIDDVYKAVIDENDGKTSWWMPHRSSKLLKGDTWGKVGSVNNITVNSKPPIQFTQKTVEVENKKLVRVVYLKGAFKGEGLWKFEDLGDKTKLSYRWKASPAGFILLRILVYLFPMEKGHSKTMKEGFNNLNQFLNVSTL